MGQAPFLRSPLGGGFAFLHDTENPPCLSNTYILFFSILFSDTNGEAKNFSPKIARALERPAGRFRYLLWQNLWKR